MHSPTKEKKLFPLGRIVSTQKAAAELDPLLVIASLARHVQGDFGVLDDGDKLINKRHIEDKVEAGRVHSEYPIDPSKPDETFWIITDGLWTDEAYTTVLFPEEY